MADNERRAEIEAVARALHEQGFGFDIDADPVARESMFSVARVVLDRVRDARGDDEAKKRRPRVPAPSGRPGSLTPPVARSPQGEDHEAARERVRYWLRHFGALDNNSLAAQEATVRAVTDDVLAALSRVSPSRDGTMAVEDVAEWLKRQRSPALRTAFLAEFARPATGEQTDHGGNQDDERRH